MNKTPCWGPFVPTSFNLITPLTIWYTAKQSLVVCCLALKEFKMGNKDFYWRILHVQLPPPLTFQLQLRAQSNEWAMFTVILCGQWWCPFAAVALSLTSFSLLWCSGLIGPRNTCSTCNCLVWRWRVFHQGHSCHDLHHCNVYTPTVHHKNQ